MSKTTNESDAAVKRDAIINSATEQIRSLLETHFRDVVRAAESSFQGDDTKSEPVAKVNFKVKWGALAASPKVAVRVGFGACYKDESEQEIDPLQAKLPINP